MNIKWELSIEKQTNYYIETLNHIKKGFYQKKRFYLLPYMPEKFRDRVIYLPLQDMALGFIDNKSINKEAKDEILIFSHVIYNKQKYKLQQTTKEFNNNKTVFIQRLNEIFPKTQNLEISISPSLFGTLGTYKLEGNKIILTPRYDRNPDNIRSLLITSLVHYFNFERKTIDTHSSKWKEKQYLSASLQKQLNTNSEPITKILDKSFAARLARESKEYFDYLGYPIFHYNLNKIIGLSPTEDALLKVLIENTNELVDFDTIAYTVWKNKADEKFSLQAISKMIERLRKKLVEEGVESNIIHTQRSIGYMLYN